MELETIEEFVFEERPSEAVAENKRVLRSMPPRKTSGETVSKLVSNSWYVRASDKILDLADDLNEDNSVYAVGVVDEEGRTVGLVIRRDLYNLLGRPFGRDVMRRQTAGEVASEVRTFPFDENILTAADDIDTETKEQGIFYYLVTDDRANFCGIFSSKDLLIYLSEITKSDISLARRIQTRMVKEFDRYEAGKVVAVGASLMAKGVGGDYYAIRRLTEGLTFAAICDVSGKGMAASLITSVLSGLINNFDFRRGLKAFLKEANAFLVSTFQRDKFVTGIFTTIDNSTAELRIFDMGHSLMYLFREGRLHPVKSPVDNLPLGIAENVDPKGFRLHLRPADLFLLISDGYIEQTNSRGEVYPTKRMETLLRGLRDANLERIKVRLFEDFHSHKGTAAQFDDVTLLALRFEP